MGELASRGRVELYIERNGEDGKPFQTDFSPVPHVPYTFHLDNRPVQTTGYRGPRKSVEIFDGPEGPAARLEEIDPITLSGKTTVFVAEEINENSGQLKSEHSRRLDGKQGIRYVPPDPGISS